MAASAVGDPEPALAADDAGHHFELGARDYQLGHFEEAITEFEAAYKLAPDPILLFNIAQSNRRLGRRERALFFYRRYLEQAPDTAPNHASAARHVEEIVDELRREDEAQRRTRELEAADRQRALLPGRTANLGGGEQPAHSLHRWTVAVTAGPALVRFGREDMDVPAAASFSLDLARGWNAGNVGLQLGLHGLFLPLPFTGLDGNSKGTSWLGGGLLSGGVRIPVAGAWALGAELGGGVLWWGGLTEGNPFSVMGQAATGPVPLPSGRIRSEALYMAGRHLFLVFAPSLTMSKSVGAGSTSELPRVVRWELSLGVGYGI